ncbi:MAG: hypothetical protein ACYS8X_04380 [Planctomycetota bacterium]|jgi:hypothetical protein
MEQAHQDNPVVPLADRHVAVAAQFHASGIHTEFVFSLGPLELLQGHLPCPAAEDSISKDGQYMLRDDEATFVSDDDRLLPKPGPPAWDRL